METTTKEDKTPSFCDICNRGFLSKFGLNRHIEYSSIHKRLVGAESIWTCELCPNVKCYGESYSANVIKGLI